MYWHTITNEKKGAHENEEDPDDPDEPREVEEPSEDEESDEVEYRFTASPGWLSNFQGRYDLGRLRMKGEKGSADHEAVDEWIHSWFTFLHTNYVQAHHKTLQQVIKIIVNFDECGFQYKSLPQYSYHSQKEEQAVPWSSNQGLHQ